MPPVKKRAAAALQVEEQAYINPFLRNSEFEVFLRPDCDKIVTITPEYGMGPRHRLGYQRLLGEDIEMMNGDQMYPIEKDFGMYWFETDESGYAIIMASTGEKHYILAMNKSVRDKKVGAEKRMLEGRNENVNDEQHTALLNRSLKRGSEFEAETDEHEETIQL